MFVGVGLLIQEVLDCDLDDLLTVEVRALDRDLRAQHAKVGIMISFVEQLAAHEGPTPLLEELFRPVVPERNLDFARELMRDTRLVERFPNSLKELFLVEFGTLRSDDTQIAVAHNQVHRPVLRFREDRSLDAHPDPERDQPTLELALVFLALLFFVHRIRSPELFLELGDLFADIPRSDLVRDREVGGEGGGYDEEQGNDNSFHFKLLKIQPL